MRQVAGPRLTTSVPRVPVLALVKADGNPGDEGLGLASEHKACLHLLLPKCEVFGHGHFALQHARAAGAAHAAPAGVGEVQTGGSATSSTLSCAPMVMAWVLPSSTTCGEKTVSFGAVASWILHE